MAFFVDKNSIVRQIWGKADTILFIFSGASAEFALNKAVDWLYFTGRLPADPMGRLFSTVSYARQIIFSDLHKALYAIDKITAIHKAVEKERGLDIPDWAYRDVLFMLIDYSVRSFELLERKLTESEKAEVFDVFLRLGFRMGIKDLPTSYQSWLIMRVEHLEQDLICSKFTIDLYKQYRTQLGPMRFYLLKQVQLLLVPENVKELLSLGPVPLLAPLLNVYKLLRYLKLDRLLKKVMLPEKYQVQIKDLDMSFGLNSRLSGH